MQRKCRLQNVTIFSGLNVSLFGRNYLMHVQVIFSHDRRWISPWMKSMSNEVDITIHVIASQLSGHYDVISNRLWRHQRNESRASETRGRCKKIVIFIVIYGLVMSCKEWNNVCTFVTNCFATFVTNCFATREINTKITLSWALKQFVTRVRTLLSLYAYGDGRSVCTRTPFTNMD